MLRLLADAKYLHQKFSVLKNVGTPSNMLETVVSEKSVAQKPSPLTPKPIIPSANERLKGLLSRRVSGNYSTTTADKVPPAASPAPPSPSPANGTPPIGGINGDSFLGTPSLGSPSRPGTPYVEPKPGFKEVAAPASPEIPKRPESPLPALPNGGDAITGIPTSATELTPPPRPPRTSSLEGKLDGLDGRDELAQSAGPNAPSPNVNN